VRSDRFGTGLFLQTIALRAARFSSARAGKQLRAGVRIQLPGVSHYRFPQCPRVQVRRQIRHELMAHGAKRNICTSVPSRAKTVLQDRHGARHSPNRGAARRTLNQSCRTKDYVNRFVMGERLRCAGLRKTRRPTPALPFPLLRASTSAYGYACTPMGTWWSNRAKRLSPSCSANPAFATFTPSARFISRKRELGVE